MFFENTTEIGSVNKSFEKKIINNDLHNSIKYNLDQKFIAKDNETIIFKKKKLIEVCKNLSKIEYLEIFNIIQEENCSFSENKNGIFINLQNVSENIIDKIFYFLEFIKLKKEDLMKQEEYLNDARKNIPIEVIEKKDIIVTDKNNILDYDLSDNDEDDKISNYLVFSSDEDDDLENKLSLKKKKTKYSGKKLKMIKSIKENDTNNKLKQKNKKVDE